MNLACKKSADDVSRRASYTLILRRANRVCPTALATNANAYCCRALATESPVLLLDEPTTHLDPPHQVALARLFRRLASSHTVITVLHDLPLAVHADRLLVMRDGAIAGHGESNDAALHTALVEAFDHAIAVIPAAAPGKRPTVSLRLDD